jgi:hypothetical protein
LQAARERAKKIALELGREQRDCGLDIDPIDYAQNTLHFGLMEVGNAGAVVLHGPG